MKRFMAIFLTVVILCGLSACGAAVTEDAQENTVSAEFEAILAEYASVLINIGLQVKNGETVIIYSPVDCAEFARLCVTAAYDAGAAEVIMSWSDNYVTREKYLKADDAVFDTVPDYLKDFENGYALQGASFLFIRSRVPNLYEGIDGDRIARASAASAEAYAVSDELAMKMEYPWCVAGVPNEAWAQTAFPDMEADEAVAALWDAILESVYVRGDGTAVETWQEHVDALAENADSLNRYHFRYLHYTNSMGTDLTVELTPYSVWKTASSSTSAGKAFFANVPSMEAYTSPNRTGSNGVVYASKPLVLDGTTVTNIKFVIEDGKIVSAKADTGEDILTNELALDETACYLGEVALVPYDSPISKMGILFYETLYDENASCHIAFGCGFADCFEGGQSMTVEELVALGMNDSAQHVDFMIGTEDLKIVGTTFDGEEVVIFENGIYSEEFKLGGN